MPNLTDKILTDQVLGNDARIDAFFKYFQEALHEIPQDVWEKHLKSSCKLTAKKFGVLPERVENAVGLR